MRTTEVDLQELAGLPALAGCTCAELAQLDARATELRVRAGRTICHQGTRAREIVIVLDGFATMTRAGVLAGQAGPGTILGGAEVAGGRDHEATVTTRSVARILVIGTADYADLQVIAPSLAGRLAGVVDVRTREVERRMPVRVPAFAFQPA